MTKQEKTREMLKSLKWVAITVVSLFTVIVLSKSLTLDKQKKELGISAVKYMYEFTELQQLQLNMVDLKSITTKPVFNQLTIDNEDRSLYTYVKFKGETTSVDVKKATSNYVIYSIVNDNVNSERRFIFMFDTDTSGKISWVREAELYDFVTYSD